jgi:hypothetical protein
MDKILIALASALQLDATSNTEFLASLKEGETWLPDEQLSAKLLELTSARVKALKSDQHKRAVRETYESLSVKMKGLGYETTEQGDAMISGFIQYASERAASNVSADVIKAHPLYTSAIADTQQAAKGELDKIRNEYDAYKSAITDKLKVDAMLRQADDVLTKNKAVIAMPALGLTKEQRLPLFVNSIPKEQVGFDSEGKLVMVDATTKEVVKDAFAKVRTYEDHVTDLGRVFFGYSTLDPDKGAPTPTGHVGAGVSIKTEADYMAAMSRETDNQKRLDLQKAYLEFQEKK